MNGCSKSCSLPAACLVLCIAPIASATLVDYPFKLVVSTEGGQKLLYAHNEGHSPVTVRITTSDVPETPSLWRGTIVQAHARMALGTVSGVSTLEYSYYVGSMDAVADTQHCYRLPFAGGHNFPVTQAYGGLLTSHDNVQSRYAIDFAMPEGTPVVAARGGIVLDVTLHYQTGGIDEYFLHRANTVTIVHDDGTVAEYAHLAPRAPLVQPGQRVAAGTRIAHSGNTGYSSAPHLHFVVTKPAVVGNKILPVSVPFRFCDENAFTVRTRGAVESR